MIVLNLADIIGIIFVIALVVWGIKRGFVKTVFSLGSLILSLILALTLYPVVTDFLAESVVGDYVRLNVYEVFSEKPEENLSAEEAGSTLKLPGSLQETIIGTTEQTATVVKETLADSMASLALKILGIIIVFILVKVILWILSVLLNAVAKLPVLRTANKFLGGITGAVYGVLLLYLILAVLTFTTTIKTFNKPIQLVVESKYISSMYNQNIILDFLK